MTRALGAAPAAAAVTEPADGGVPMRLQRRCACGSKTDSTEECDSCRRKKLVGSGAQAFSVGPANDAWEREAERIAGEAMNGGRRSAITPLRTGGGVQRRAVQGCPTGKGDQGTIKRGPLAKWDWVSYVDHVKLGNRVFKSQVKKNGVPQTDANGQPLMAGITVGAWPWLTNNPGDITVDKGQIGQPRNAQNRAYDFGALPRRSVNTGRVPLAVFATMDEGFAGLEKLLAEPDYRNLSLRAAVDLHLGGKDNKKRMAGVDNTDTAVARIVQKLGELGIKASAQTRLSTLAAAGQLDEAAQAFGFAEGVGNVGLTYRCNGRDKADDGKIAATVWKTYLGQVPDSTPPEVAALLCCDPPAQRSADGTAAPGAGAELSSGPGQPLPATVRERMQLRLGHDFGRVRVHTDAAADRSARSVGAQAYTLGADIVFAHGRFDPASRAGEHLLAHELVHVVQQGGGTGRLQRDLAVKPQGVDQTLRTLSEADIRDAIAENGARFKNPQQLAQMRDVLGLPKQPAKADRDFALAVGRFQAAHGVAQDGKLGPVTTLLLVEEFQAEGLGAGAGSLKAAFGKGTLMDVDASHCPCKPVLEREIKSADHFIAEYQTCGADPAVADGPAVEACIKDRAKAAGASLTTLGTTAPGGAVVLTGARKGACGELMTRIDLAHEQIHSVHEKELQQQHGKGAAFKKAREDKTDWVENEVASRNTDKSLALWALALLKQSCP